MKTINLHIALIALTFNILLLTHKVKAQVSFSPATNLASGSEPYTVMTADFNNDSKTDLVVSNYSTNSVSILLGNGLGSFGSATNFAVCNSGTNPRSIICADFNGDGNTDLATANEGGLNNVSVLLGNGMGGFGVAINLTTGGSPQSVSSGDFNGDNKADLVVANAGSNDISIFLGDGIGGFGTAANFTVSAYPVSVICEDFNGDGKVDLAVANNSSYNISVLLGDGAGSFGSATNFAVGDMPYSIISADFNGDGKVDLAVANLNSANVSVLLGDGIGGFSPSTNFMSGVSSRSVVSRDFNGDGKADLAVANVSPNNVSVLLGNGLGSFGTATNFAVGSTPFALASVDFNVDGKPDLVVANYSSNNVSILLNNSTPPTPPICLVTVDSTHTHNLLIWEKANLNMPVIDSFVVYREITTNNYQRIGVVLYDSLSTFDDFNANPASTGYRYKLKSKNILGVESPFSDYHNTIYLTNTGANFSWTPYQIENNTTPVSAYYIYRDDNSTGNFQTIGNTTGNQLGYTDVNFTSYPNAQYYVEAVIISGACDPTRSSYTGSRSNVKYFGTAGIQQLNNNSLINIYPTPANNELTITGIKDKTTIRLYDVVGKLLLEKEVENNTTINTTMLTVGVYTLFTENKIGRIFNKVVISR